MDSESTVVVVCYAFKGLKVVTIEVEPSLQRPPTIYLSIYAVRHCTYSKMYGVKDVCYLGVQ